MEQENSSENPQIQNNQPEDKSSQQVSSGKKQMFWSAVFTLAGLIVACAILFTVNHGLKKQIASLEMQNKSLEDSFTQAINENRKIYVFDMDSTIQSMGLQELSMKFENDINDLNEQVKAAKDKINNLKDDKVKADVSDMYLTSLQMKRDELIKSYDEMRQRSLDSINASLAELATEMNLPTIFINKSVMVNTNYVIDVTPQVIEKIKTKLQK